MHLKITSLYSEIVTNFATDFAIETCYFLLNTKLLLDVFNTTIFRSLIKIIKQYSLSLRGMSNLCMEVSKSKFTTKET